MDGPAIITQVTNPKEDEGRAPGASEKGEEGRGRGGPGAWALPARPELAAGRRRGLGEGCRGAWVRGAPQGGRLAGAGGRGSMAAQPGAREGACASPGGGGGNVGPTLPAGSLCVRSRRRRSCERACVFLAGWKCVCRRQTLEGCVCT